MWSDPVIITAALGVISAVMAFFAGRRKSNAEADITLVGGFKDLLKELRAENSRLAASVALVDSSRRKRITNLEEDCEALVRRNEQLEISLRNRGIDVPPAVGE